MNAIPLPSVSSAVSVALEAEQAILGQLLMEPGLLSSAGNLAGKHFFEPLHADLFASIGATLEKGLHPEPPAIRQELGAHPALESLGGAAFIADLVNRAPPTNTFATYVNVVVKAWVDRRRTELGGALAAAATNGADTTEIEAELRRLRAEETQSERPLATSWVWKDPKSLPHRQWLYGRHYIRKYVSATVAPGGIGKSALEVCETLCLASGQAILGIVPEERVKVWYLNLEDPIEETERRIAAACLHYNLSAADLEGWLMIGGRETEITLASQGREGLLLNEPLIARLCQTIANQKIGAVIVDPFVSSHRVAENDNGAVDAVVKAWARIADKTGCAVELVHHVKKGQAGVATAMEDSRGAVSLIGAVRSGRVLNAMTEDEAVKAGVDDPRPYFRVNNGKANLAPANGGSDWYRFVSVDLGNGDNVGVVTAWNWPAQTLIKVDDVSRVQMAMAHLSPEDGRVDYQSPRWLGHLVADVLKLDMAKSKQQIRHLLDTWEACGYLAKETRKDAKRMDRKHYVVAATPENIAVWQGVASVAPDCHTTTPSLEGWCGVAGSEAEFGCGAA